MDTEMMTTRAVRIKSRFKTLNEYLEWYPPQKKMWRNSVGLATVVDKKMRPIVTSTDWSVCIDTYTRDLYCVDKDKVRKIRITDVLSCNAQGDYVPYKGMKLVKDQDFIDFCPKADFCGEADDLSSYFWFNYDDEVDD